MKRPTLLDGLTGVAVVGLLSLAIWIAVAGPEGPLPMHFDASGQVDRWGDRTQLALLIGGLGLLAAVISGLTGLAVARAEDPARRRGLISSQAVGLVAVVGVALMAAALGLNGAGDLQPALPMALISLLLAAIGAAAGRIGPNPVIGVRTPWSYKSRRAWDRSNRLMGRLFFWIGLAGLAAAPFAPQPLGLTALIVALLAAAALAVFESWRVWRDDPDRQPF